MSVFRQMRADGVVADRNSYFFAVSACSRRGEARTALELLAEMTAGQAKEGGRAGGGGGGGGGPAPDLLLYAVTVKACAGGKSWRQALRVLDEMSAAGGEFLLLLLVVMALVLFLFRSSRRKCWAYFWLVGGGGGCRWSF